MRPDVVFHDGEPFNAEAVRFTVQRVSYFKCYLGKQFEDAYLLGLGGPMQDADELDNLVSSKGRGLYGKNERVDQLFDLGRATLDPAKRRAVYGELARAMVEDATSVWMDFHPATLT